MSIQHDSFLFRIRSKLAKENRWQIKLSPIMQSLNITMEIYVLNHMLDSWQYESSHTTYLLAKVLELSAGP